MILVTVTTDTSHYEYWVEDSRGPSLGVALETLSDNHPANTHRVTDPSVQAAATLDHSALLDAANEAQALNDTSL